MFQREIIVRFIIIYPFLAVAIAGGDVQANPPRAGVQFNALLARFDSDLQLSPGLGVGGAFYLVLTPQVKFQIEAEAFRTPGKFETIGGAEQLDILLNSAVLQFYVAPFGNQEALALALSLGMGVQQIIREAHQIYLGALGRRDIPEKRNTSLLHSAGLQLSQALNSRISISVSPQLRFFSESGMKYNFYVCGGLAIGIF